MVIHGFRNQQNAPAKNYNCNANPNFSALHFWLASALAHLGQLEEAKYAVQAGLALDPSFTVSRYRKGALSSNPVYLAQRERVLDGMRKAGVPE